MSAENQNCEVSRDSCCWGTALQTHPLLGNGSVAATWWLQQTCPKQKKNCCKRCFLCGPCRSCMTGESQTSPCGTNIWPWVPAGLDARSDCAGWLQAVTYWSAARVKTGSNTSTVTLRVVGGVEKGSLKSETVKYGRESQETRTREWLRWQGPAAYTKDRPVLSSKRAAHKNMTVTVKQ
jgi:hypothetical protein